VTSLHLIDSVDVTVKTVETLFVYCDVFEHVVMGDMMAPLLRIVDMKCTPENGRMHKILSPPLCVPLQKKHFDTVKINIMTDTGVPYLFPLNTGNQSRSRSLNVWVENYILKTMHYAFRRLQL